MSQMRHSHFSLYTVVVAAEAGEEQRLLKSQNLAFTIFDWNILQPYIHTYTTSSRTAQSKFKPQLVASTELHKNEHTYQVWPSKPILKDKHPQKLPEEPIQVVVSILIVLAGLCNVKHSDFPHNINNILLIFLKSKARNHLIKQFCHVE